MSNWYRVPAYYGTGTLHATCKLQCCGSESKFNVFVSVFRIRISFYADHDPGSQKCPYGSGSRPLIFYSDPDPDPRGVKTNFQQNFSK